LEDTVKVELSEQSIESLASAISAALIEVKREDDELVDLDVLCTRLCISKNTVYWLVRTKRNLPVRRGRPLKFSLAAVKEWMRKK
jgi:hypothetical protein